MFIPFTPASSNLEIFLDAVPQWQFLACRLPNELPKKLIFQAVPIPDILQSIECAPSDMLKRIIRNVKPTISFSWRTEWVDHSARLKEEKLA
jgi:hypothetical protein